jgi:hypothetical protein
MAGGGWALFPKCPQTLAPKPQDPSCSEETACATGDCEGFRNLWGPGPERWLRVVVGAFFFSCWARANLVWRSDRCCTQTATRQDNAGVAQPHAMRHRGRPCGEGRCSALCPRTAAILLAIVLALLPIAGGQGARLREPAPF